MPFSPASVVPGRDRRHGHGPARADAGADVAVLGPCPERLAKSPSTSREAFPLYWCRYEVYNGVYDRAPRHARAAERARERVRAREVAVEDEDEDELARVKIEKEEAEVEKTVRMTSQAKVATVVAKVKKFNPEVDEGALAYFEEMVASGDAAPEDLRDMIEGLVDRELSNEEFESLYAEMADTADNDDDDDGSSLEGPKALTEEQLSKIQSLNDAATETTTEADNDIHTEGKKSTNQKKSRKKKEKKKSGKTLAQRNAEERARETAARAEELKAKDGEFQTKRFERFHKTWMGWDHWKVHDHAMAAAVEELEDDDYSSAWLECLRLGIPWGGRGAGGRGVMRMTGQLRDVHLPNVTMARGKTQLLYNATLKLVYGRRYALAGANGCGKTTLFRRIATGALPGFPPYLRVQYVEQELKGTDLKPLEYVVKYDFERTRLMKEEETLLEGMEDESRPAEEVIKTQERLQEVYERLEAISAWDAEARAENALRDLGFTDALLNKTTNELSGGWRMRVALCGTLFMKPDILLLDEPTNHLDALGVEWLRTYLNDKSKFEGTLLFVSHDRAFMNAVADELIVLRNKQFAYFNGTYSEYREMLDQKRAMQSTKLQAQQKKKDHLQDYIASQQRAARDRKSKGGDVKKQKQIASKKKQIEKIDRMGLGREDGKKWKQSYDCEGLPSALDVDERPLNFNFPPSNAGPGKPDEILVQFDGVAYGWPGQPDLVQGFTAQVPATARIGILGQNGVGKSSLVKLLLQQAGSVELRTGPASVSLGVDADKISIFEQNMINALPEADDLTPADLILSLPRGPLTVDCQTFEQARVYLGGFGLTGDLATQPIRTLSGGQKSRLCIAREAYQRNRLWVMDEIESHLDISSIERLQEGIAKYDGAIIIVSHDRAFLAESCKTLWVFDSKTKSIQVKHTPEPADVLSAYDAFLARNMPRARAS
ncbi:ABC transporter ATP-binding protein ARB1 [Hondaea fermentalgiana]|uniref:ABC transporter ATP-binding protein ARB1 n=1 Tax=Hondaea fermentalgiana TaxID=2315210 RepID=A0A2R5G9F8_9STRA|nr:ABC transporter ATP-binding protein ARB1 [Hondaea fermentalgiana]|eukprot:GBG24701.1 ABC transporter ATP-binding protein ARB1 [Hondaea fermentalgiana]